IPRSPSSRSKSVSRQYRRRARKVDPARRHNTPDPEARHPLDSRATTHRPHDHRLTDRNNIFDKRVRSVRHRGNVVSDRQTEEVRLLSDRLRFSERGVAIQIRPHPETLSFSDSLVSTPTVRFIYNRVLKTPARNLVDARNRRLRMLRLQEDDNPSAELIQNFIQIRPPLGTPGRS